jgi:CheY-like chemotaxis protein
MPHPGHPFSVLIVDDDPQGRELLRRLLTSLGYIVQTAPDGRAALGIVDATQPDLILSDLQMPHMGGRGLIHEVRRRGRTMPIVLMSADPGAIILPPDVLFFPKPVDLQRLIEVIDTLTALASPLPVISGVLASVMCRPMT